jgi:hypothetical protein
VATQELHQQIDRYLIRRVLGTGAMGSVYAAYDPKLHREVAIKVVPARLSVDPKGRERFSREARAIAAVRHPNIVEIYDYSGTESPHLYLVIEKLDGQDLYATLHRNGLMNEAVAVAVGHELCLALQVLHEAGIIHRDLKPENVFLCQNGRIVLTDFGIVKAVRDGAAVDGYRDSTDVIGTPGFMAPELMSGRDLGPPSDVFALGVLLYNIVTNRLPFEGATPLDMFKAAAAGTYPDPRSFAPTLSPEFCELLKACMQPNPRRRPASAEGVRQALKGIIEELGAVDVRDDLNAYSKNSSAFALFAHKRAVRRVITHIKVAAKDRDRVALEAQRRRLQVLDPFNEEIAEVSGVMHVGDARRQRRLARFKEMFTGHLHTLAKSGIYNLHRMQDSLPRGAFAGAGLIVLLGAGAMLLHRQAADRPPAGRPLTVAGLAPATPLAAVGHLAPRAVAAALPGPPGPVPTTRVGIVMSNGAASLRIDGRPVVFAHGVLRLVAGQHVFEFIGRTGVVRRLVDVGAAAVSVRVDLRHRQIRVRYST